MTQLSAISNLGNQKPEHFWRDVAHGIHHLVSNIQRLDGSARRASKEGDESIATLLGSFADEEAAKVLILVDAVRCPQSKAEARARTLRRWSNHLWKGIYARACDWRPVDFSELASYVDRGMQPFHLDGPLGVDWIFRNDITSKRERHIYVDLVEDITEAGKDGRERDWVTPEDFTSSMARYRTSTCVEVALSLHAHGISTERGLQHVAAIWQPIDPESMDSLELFAKIGETLSAVRLDPGVVAVQEEDPPSPSSVAYWPFPLWPIGEPGDVKHGELLEALRAARDAELKRIHRVQGLKDPPPEISLEKVLEMDAAYARVGEERQRRTDSHFAGKSGPHIITAEVDLDVSETAAWKELRKLWWGLSEGERVSLVALAWFTRDTAANWPASLEMAQQRSDIHSTRAERYYLGLGHEWLLGFRQWEAPADQMWIGSG